MFGEFFLNFSKILPLKVVNEDINAAYETIHPFYDYFKFSVFFCSKALSHTYNIYKYNHYVHILAQSTVVLWNWYHYHDHSKGVHCNYSWSFKKNTQQSGPVSNGELTSLSATDSRGRDGGLWGAWGVRGRHTSLRCRAQTDVFVDRRFIYSRRGFVTARGDSFETVFSSFRLY